MIVDRWKVLGSHGTHTSMVDHHAHTEGMLALCALFMAICLLMAATITCREWAPTSWHFGRGTKRGLQAVVKFNVVC